MSHFFRVDRNGYDVQPVKKDIKNNYYVILTLELIDNIAHSWIRLQLNFFFFLLWEFITMYKLLLSPLGMNYDQVLKYCSEMLYFHIFINKFKNSKKSNQIQKKYHRKLRTMYL